MRLTLRTMLAYLDGILDSEDAEEIGKKIDDSEFATNLLHRTRDVMRRLRLAAPAVADRGPGLDANTVAEYLDNTLHDDRVPDFEKVCLDSDVHLAEVASCHQILTLVLGEAAEIDSAARQRMYQLPDLVAAPAESPGGTALPPPVPDRQKPDGGPLAAKKRDKPTIPDYLREPRKKRRWLPAAAAVVLVACVAALLLGYFGYLDRDGALICALLGPPAAEENAQPQQQGAVPEPSAADSQPPQGPETDVPVDPAKVTGSPAEPSTNGDALPGPAEDQSPPVAPLPPEMDSPPTLPVPKSDTETPPIPAADTPPDTQADTPPETQPDTPPETTPDEPPPGPTPQPRRMGALTSEKQILLRYTAESATWQRVPTEGILLSDEPLVALTRFRPRITLSTGVTLQVVGGTRIELLGDADGEPAGLRIRYGRVSIKPLAEAGSRLRLVVGDCSGTITFADAESLAAVAVSRALAAGTDPETAPAAETATLYAKTGQIRWEQVSPADGAPAEGVLVESGSCLVVGPQPAGGPFPVERLPEWITPQPPGELDRRATSKVELSLGVDRAAGLVLTELADPDYPREEVRRLAARCLADIGQFDSMVAALDNSDQRLDWPEYYIEYLQRAVSRGPEQAAAIRQAIQRQYREGPDALYRMLWGYSARDLEGGEDATLVEHLNSKVLALRVLSFWNLQRITGFGLYYHPEQTEAKRQGPLRSWRKRLEAGEIRIEPPADQDNPPPKIESETADQDGPPSENVPDM